MAEGPDFALDYDGSIAEAKEMFLTLYPDEEFLPRAPEPEEIIMDGYDDKDHPEEDEEKDKQYQPDDKDTEKVDDEKEQKDDV